MGKHVTKYPETVEFRRWHLTLKCTPLYISGLLFRQSSFLGAIHQDRSLKKRSAFHGITRLEMQDTRSSILVQDHTVFRCLPFHDIGVEIVVRVPRFGCCAHPFLSPPLVAPSLVSSPASTISMYFEGPFSPQSSGLSKPLPIRVAPRSFRVGVPPTADHDSVEIKHDLSVAIKASHVEMCPEKSASFARPIF